MADNREMWQSLGMDLETHDQLCAVLPTAFGDVYLSQENRPAGMAFYDFVVSDITVFVLPSSLSCRSRAERCSARFACTCPMKSLLRAAAR